MHVCVFVCVCIYKCIYCGGSGSSSNCGSGQTGTSPYLMLLGGLQTYGSSSLQVRALKSYN